MIVGNTDGSTATTPILLVALFPKALAGWRLGERGVALATCFRLVRLSVKLIGTDWFATRIMSAPSASRIPCWSAPWTPLCIPPIIIAKLRVIVIIPKQTLLRNSLFLPLFDATYSAAPDSRNNGRVSALPVFAKIAEPSRTRPIRSEERRVGKECRSRVGADD